MLNGSRLWRAAVCVVSAGVITSAGIAGQRVGAAVTRPLDRNDSRTITFTGTTRPDTMTPLALTGAAVVEELLVRVGDHVQAGQSVLALNDRQPHEIAERLRLDVARARNRVAQLESIVAILDQSIEDLTASSLRAAAEVGAAQQLAQNAPGRQSNDSPERAQAMYDAAVASERKVAELAASGVAAMQDLEQAQIAVRGAAESLTAARRGAAAAATLASAQALQARTQADMALADFRRDRQERLGELADARLTQSAAESTLSNAIEAFGDLSLRTPVAGVVTELAAKAGDAMPAGSVVARIAVVTSIVVDLEVPRTVAGKLRRGQPAVVHLVDSGEEFPASIRSIAPLPDKAGTYRVETAFENPAEALVSGRAALVRFPLSD